MCQVAQGIDKRKAEEHKDSIDHCLTDRETLDRFNQIKVLDHADGIFEIRNNFYHSQVVSFWLNQVTQASDAAQSDNTAEFVYQTLPEFKIKLDEGSEVGKLIKSRHE